MTVPSFAYTAFVVVFLAFVAAFVLSNRRRSP
jgi:hypothetical protein